MIESIIGFILFVLSLITYSVLHSEEIDPRIFDLKKLGLYTVAIVLAFTIEGIMGLLVLFKVLNKVYHGVYGFSLILAVETIILLHVLILLNSATKIHIGKEALDCFVYTVVIVLTLERINQYTDIENFYFALVTTVIVLTIIFLGLGIYVLKVYRDLMELVESINIVTLLKTGCLSLSLYGVAGILHTFCVELCLTTLLIAHIILLVAGLQFLWDLMNKYYIPLKRYNVQK